MLAFPVLTEGVFGRTRSLLLFTVSSHSCTCQTSSQRSNTDCCEETTTGGLSVQRVPVAMVVTPRSIRAYSWPCEWQRNGFLKFVFGKGWPKSIPELINSLCWFAVHSLLGVGCHLSYSQDYQDLSKFKDTIFNEFAGFPPPPEDKVLQ